MTPDFPLPLGHYFGPSKPRTVEIRCHDGRGNEHERLKLAHWSRTFNERWRGSLSENGIFQGDTHAAAFDVQNAVGLEPTGVIDFDTWRACWEAEVPQPRAERLASPPPTRGANGRRRAASNRA